MKRKTLAIQCDDIKKYITYTLVSSNFKEILTIVNRNEANSASYYNIRNVALVASSRVYYLSQDWIARGKNVYWIYEGYEEVYEFRTLTTTTR